VLIQPTFTMAVVLFVVSTSPGLVRAQDEVIGFKMPSNNIYCIVEPPYENHPATDLRCDIQKMAPTPKPPKDCDLSWGDAFAIAQDGNLGSRICHGDTTKDDSLPVLAYGKEWAQGGYKCKSETSGLTCTNAKGHGFKLSRAVQQVF
jgi:hypothetical protein